jgi:SAM-dependent methyltransferase
VTASAAAAPPVAGPLAYLTEAFAAAAALQTAGRLGVLARLDGGPATATELAGACAISERGARLVLGALAGLGLAEGAGGGTWRAALPDLAGLAGTARIWAHLDEALRENRPPVSGDTPDGAAALYPEVVGHLGAMLAGVAERAATLLPPGARVLDAGAGAAPWSLAVAARDPSCAITAVDLPAVVPATRRAVRDVGLQRQFRFLAGDLFQVELGRGVYDLAIAGNLCHLFDEAANRRLLGRLYGALRPGGTLAIVDVIPDGHEQPRPRWVALYELGLLLRTAGGRVHPLAAYHGWLCDAGFQPTERHLLADQAQAVLLVARKPPRELREPGHP